MTPEQIAKLREDMSTTEYCFGRIFGAPPVDVVQWESGERLPSPRQEMFMQYARRALDLEHVSSLSPPSFADIYTHETAVKALAWFLCYGGET